MEKCSVLMEEMEQKEEKFKLCTKANLGLLACTLLLAGCAAAVLLMRTGTQGPQQQDDIKALRLSLRQTNVRAAIHLDGKYTESSASVEWKLNVDQSYYGGGLALENNEIVVPHSGPYFVYSQASYRVNCKSEEEEDEDEPASLVHLSHTVERLSDSYGAKDSVEHDYRPILHAVRTACQKHPKQGHWFSGIYVGAMFNLMTGDRLRVNLTNDPEILAQLEDGHGDTFFGVFAL
ncbi:tumor necrosis factor a (TNF superfamily, member 2) [Periophthalmus magnuspinnatus]|uniref:tumor necrosis factor a (TNF superfamily, member 2) n=1 Tax=Periophthalmus magnuspinnatus TaxID=409849 RepID=UPI00145AB939|nr:tumor necrosis factor a (TNF superfamily, member 2) [Periophthalmus magnuspinnatus]